MDSERYSASGKSGEIDAPPLKPMRTINSAAGAISDCSPASCACRVSKKTTKNNSKEVDQSGLDPELGAAIKEVLRGTVSIHANQ